MKIIKLILESLLFIELLAKFEFEVPDRFLAGTTPTNAPVANGEKQECNQEMMLSYGLTGRSSAELNTHRYCPLITENCCTEDDEVTSMFLWTNEYKDKVERYYEVYLYSIKYILGFSQEILSLAKDYEKSTNLQCKTAALDYIQMNINPKVTTEIYKSFVVALEKIGDLRRGFFCTLCDARTQARLRDFWAITNIFYQDRIYFSKEFCRKLVDNTIRSSYFSVYYLKRYTENLSSLMNCKSGNTTQLVYDVPFWTRQQVKNCFFFKNKYFFFFCERYCEKFHLTKPSQIFDGDLPQLKKFVDHIMKFREQVFYYPKNNILMDSGIGAPELFLEDNYDEVLRNTVFFKASTSQVMLDKFKTDIVYFGGMDPWESSESSLYQIVLAGVNNIGIIYLILTVMMIYIK